MMYLLIKIREFVEMCGKKTKSMDFRCDIPFLLLMLLLEMKGMPMQSITYSEMAHARPKPSYVDVPENRYQNHRDTKDRTEPRPSSLLSEIPWSQTE